MDRRWCRRKLLHGCCGLYDDLKHYEGVGALGIGALSLESGRVSSLEGSVLILISMILLLVEAVTVICT